jgi:hypothetical protein
MESKGTRPARIRPQDVRISRGVMLGLIAVDDILRVEASFTVRGCTFSTIGGSGVFSC